MTAGDWIAATVFLVVFGGLFLAAWISVRKKVR